MKSSPNRCRQRRVARAVDVLAGLGQVAKRLFVGATLSIALLAGTACFAFGAPAADAPLPLGFPRVANWSPDLEKPGQTIDKLAKYDYLVLYDMQPGLDMAALRQANRDIILLTYTSAVEVGLQHDLLKQVPARWMLQQVGTKLKSAATTDTTTFEVEKTDVFRVGQVVVVDEELVKVKSVKSGAIEVERGLVPQRSPAAPHSAGARIAAVVQRRSTTIEMNLTADCPSMRPLGRPSEPQQTWAEFAADVAGDRCENGWDGVVTDRVENNESFLVARTDNLIESIDSKLSNVKPTDGYAAFDKAWIAGVRHYLEEVREEVGPKHWIVGNNAAPHYDLLNGSNLESFPRFTTSELPAMPYKDSYTAWWNRGRGFYDAWAASGKQANLSTIMTYDYEPEPTTEKPLPAPGGTGDYKKMRFGLATALMGDGFFTYQVRVWGPQPGLFWFDEYDNAGQKKGYLGRPISDQRLALGPLTTSDKLGGKGSFKSTKVYKNWKLFVGSGYSGSKALKSGTARVVVSKSGSRVDGVAFYSGYFKVASQKPYTVRFRARADRKTTARVRIATRNAPWRDWMTFQEIPLSTSWKTYEYTSYSKGGDADARIVFDLAGAKKTVWLDDVKVQDGGRLNVLRRDFENGVVLVNGTDRWIDVPLSTTFKRIKGTQQPGVNNGATVNVVKSMPPKDGLVLLRVSGTATRIPTFLTGAASPSSPTSYRAPVRISGTLRHTTSSGSPVTGQTVYVQTSGNGKTGWKSVATLKTPQSGYVSWTATPRYKTYYRLRYNGRAGCWFGATSPVRVVIPRPQVDAPSTPDLVSRNAAFSARGMLYPRHTAGTSPIRVYRYRYVSGKWKSYGYATAKVSDVSGESRYSVSLKLPDKGKWKLRAYHPADSSHQAAWSSVRYLTVK